MSLDVSVLTTAHDVADARLHRVVAAMTRAGLSIEVIGLGMADDAPPAARVETLPRRGLASRAVRALSLPFRARGRVIFTLDPDLVPAASLRCAVARRRLVVDVHEDFRALLRDRAWARGLAGQLARLMVSVSERLAARADLTVVADNHVPPLEARDRLVVRNLPDRRLLPKPRSLDSSPRAVYIGDVRASRGLRPMLAAIEAAPGWRLDIVGPVAPADVEGVAQWHKASVAADRVTFHGRMPPERAWAIAAGAWCGFALLEETPAFREAVPSKLYEYLAVGVPVMVTPLRRMKEIVHASGAGEVVETAAQAAATLTAWAADRDRMVDMSRRARTWAGVHVAESPYEALATTVRTLTR